MPSRRLVGLCMMTAVLVPTSLAVPLMQQRQEPLIEGDAALDSAATEWALPDTVTSLSSLTAAMDDIDLDDVQVLQGSPAEFDAARYQAAANGAPKEKDWNVSINSIRVVYPSKDNRKTIDFQAQPLDISWSRNVTLEYEVYFPQDFNFEHGGVLPGIYGGDTTCRKKSKRDLLGCYSTQLLWAEGGAGAARLHAPRLDLSKNGCNPGAKIRCDLEAGALTMGRSMWTFSTGKWTTIRLDLWLNTPGKADGGLNIWINGKLVLVNPNLYYRDVSPASTLAGRVGAWWKRSVVAISRRFDDGHWKGINGYPGDPGYNGIESPHATAATGDVVTYRFTEVVTWPQAGPTVTVTETETVTETVTETADPAPTDDAPARRGFPLDTAAEGMDEPTVGTSMSTDGSASNAVVNEELEGLESIPTTDDNSASIEAEAAKKPAPKAPAKAPPKPAPPVKKPVPPPPKVVTQPAKVPSPKPAPVVPKPIVSAPQAPPKVPSAPAPPPPPPLPPVIITVPPQIVTVTMPPPAVEPTRIVSLVTVPPQIVTVTVPVPAPTPTVVMPIIVAAPGYRHTKQPSRHREKVKIVSPIIGSERMSQRPLFRLPRPAYRDGFGGIRFSFYPDGVDTRTTSAIQPQQAFFRHLRLRINQ